MSAAPQVPFPVLPKGAGPIAAEASAAFTATASGLKYRILREGTGVKPLASQTVEVHYHGWLPEGRVFDSSYQRGQTISFGLNQVIRGWTEGMQLMVPGDKMRFWIPERLAYKGEGNGPRGMLVFEVELLAVTP